MSRFRHERRRVADLSLQETADEVVRLLTTESDVLSQPYRLRSRLAVSDQGSSSSLEFNLDAVLTGPGDQECLITVQVMHADQLHFIRNQIRALTTWLARTGSRRPLTLIAIANDSANTGSPTGGVRNAEASDQEAVGRVLRELTTLCRVVVIRLDEKAGIKAASAIRGQLAPLLPLELPTELKKRQAPIERLQQKVNETAAFAEDSLAEELIKASSKSSDAVAVTLKNWIEKCISDAHEVLRD